MPDSTELVSPAIQTGTQTWLEKAKNFQIVDQESLIIISAMALDIKRFRTKTVEMELGPPKEATNKAHKVASALFNKYVNPLKSAEEQCTTKISAYQQEMERIRLKAADEAQKSAEDSARKDRERLDNEALNAVEKGDEEGLARAKAEKEMVDPQDHLPVPTPPEKMPQGVSTRANWQAEVTDLPALIRAVMEGHAPQNFIVANEKTIGKYGKATEGTQKIPGIRFYDKGTVSLRT